MKDEGWTRLQKIGGTILLISVSIEIVFIALCLYNFVGWNSERAETVWVDDAWDHLETAATRWDSWEMYPYLHAAESILSNHGENTWYLVYLTERCWEISEMDSEVQYRREVRWLKDSLWDYPLPGRNSGSGAYQGHETIVFLMAAIAWGALIFYCWGMATPGEF